MKKLLLGIIMILVGMKVLNDSYSFMGYKKYNGWSIWRKK